MGEQEEDLGVVVDKLIRVATVRRWWLLVPTVVVAVGACATSIAAGAAGMAYRGYLGPAGLRL